MKKAIISILLALLVLPACAAPFRQKRKALIAENAALKAQLDSTIAGRDSLKTVLDSLMIIFAEPSEELRDSVNSESGSLISEKQTYTQAQTDSLLLVWYENAFAEEDAEIIQDSVRFTTNVPDSVLIKRLADMNAFIQLPFNSTIRSCMILYSERSKREMERIMGLSNYYFPIFEEVFSKYELPLELKYLAVIESHLKPNAKSKAGAKGMWQFMYTPAKGYGLTMNSFVDERYDPRKSTEAAAKYLRDAYKVFGDWSLAICSYNCGVGGVNKAIHRADGKRDFWSIYPYLPKETRGYLPAFVAAMYAMTYAREYGIGTKDVGLPVQADTVQVRSRLHFKQISEVVGIPIDEIKALNPQYLHDIIPGTEKEPYAVALPPYWAAAFVDAERQGLYEHRAEELVGAKVMKTISTAPAGYNRIAHKVQKGDTLWSLSRRYHVSVTQLRKWNNIPESNNIRIGQTLYIYR